MISLFACHADNVNQSVSERAVPEVLGGQLAAQQHRGVLAHRLLDDPAALCNTRDDLERPVPERLRVLLILFALQETAQFPTLLSIQVPHPL